MATEPADGAQTVALDASIRVTFDRPVDPDTVRYDSMEVGAPGRGTVAGRTELAPAGDGRVLLWTPDEPLFAEVSHQWALDESLRSQDGLPLAQPRTFVFRTTGAAPPEPIPHRGALRATAGRLQIGRRSHTATRLADGRVLVAGGFRQDTAVTDRAELYENEAFELTANRMVHPRAGHVAVRLADGRILLAGGWYEAQIGQLQTTDHAEVFDPATGRFEGVGPMTTQRVDHRALLLSDGRVLVTGGSRLDGSVLTDLASIEVFDPTTNSFSLLPQEMDVTRATHVMEYLGADRILLYGGSGYGLRPEIFDVATGSLHTLDVPAQDGVRFGAMGARFANGSVAVMGGDDRGTVMHVDAATESAQNTGSGLTLPRAYGTATRISNDRILVVGGFDLSRGFHLLNSADLVVAGGIAGSETFATELRFPTGMALHTATLLADGSVLFCGGLNDAGGLPELDAAYLFEPWE